MVELHMMADRKETEKGTTRKANDTVNDTRESSSSSVPVDQEKVPAQTDVPSDSTSTVASLRNTTPHVKSRDSYQKQIQEQGHYLPQRRSMYGYDTYSGYDGTYSDWNSNAYYVQSEGFGGHYSAVPPKSPAQLARGYYPMGNSYSSVNQGQGAQHSRNTSTNYRPYGRTWEDCSKINAKEKFNQRRYSDGFTEQICGPRADKKDTLSPLNEKDSLSCSIHQNKYNLPDFQTLYDHAKFYMIKSYNEDDVHKSIKYSVWASTAGGNKRLNDAFRDAENIAKQNATKCPVFLFFSVNTSGKYLGVAEMLGQVDFKKSMNFWQEERWNGFFPLKWHIIKDVPNVNFRSIILQNNDNRPVYFSRDTQQIPLPQGLKMLDIFKSYEAESSILEDFGFYDDREKLLRARRSCIPSLVCSEEENEKDFDHLDHLDEAMKDMQLSARPVKTTSDARSNMVAMKRAQF